MTTIAFLALVSTAGPLLVAWGIYDFVSKTREFAVTRLVWIAIWFFILIAAVNLFAGVSDYFAYSSREEVDEEISGRIVGAILRIVSSLSIFIIVFLPIIIGKDQYVALSFYYMLVNSFLYVIMGLYTGIVSDGQLGLAAIKFFIVLYVLKESLRKIIPPR